LIKRPIRSKRDTAASACTGITYERRSARADVDGVQGSIGAYPVEHASARLKTKVAYPNGDRADRGDQGAVIWVDLDERARPGGRGKEAAVWMEGNPAQAHAGKRRADQCAGAICLINCYQRTTIRSQIAITTVQR
jgi:hypothetical protein